MAVDGMINVYKEKGFTSHDVVAIIKKTLKIKAGHTGTLDPDAVGVLPVCLGKCTKLADYVTDGKKGYRAVLKLGIETDTEDTSGNIISQKEVQVSREEILAGVLSFVGVYEQIPPMYSAIKVNGQKLYDLARQGIEIERKSRLIHIYSINSIEFIDETSLKMDIICSKGTYIRSLCRDIGQKLGCGGTMGELIRISSGNFNIETSIKISQIKEYAEIGTIDSYILPTDKVLDDLEQVYVKQGAYKYLYNGNKVNISYAVYSQPLMDGKKYRVYNEEKKFIGIYEFCENAFLKPVLILTELGNL